MTRSPTIVEVEAHEVIVPTHPGANNSPELGSFLRTTTSGEREIDWDELPICLLEVRFDDGVVGLGEVGRGNSLKDIEPWLKRLPGLSFPGPGLAGLPEEWRNTSILLEAHPTAHWQTRTPVASALEMALLDAAGKRLGCRVVDLLGGAYREEVPVDYWCGRQTPANLTRIVTRACELGFHGIKMKSRVGDPVIEQVRAIRAAGGDDFSITIDPMFQWLSPHDSLHVLRALEQFGGNLRVEDPFPQDQPDFWLRARNVCSVPIVWHMRGMESLRRALRERCADNFNCAGTAAEFLTATHALEVAGYSCWHGSSLELGVGQVSCLHATAAARACTMASDFQSGFIRQHTLITWDWPYKDGKLPLPDGPGLGIELDRDALAHYRCAHETFSS